MAASQHVTRINVGLEPISDRMKTLRVSSLRSLTHDPSPDNKVMSEARVREIDGWIPTLTYMSLSQNIPLYREVEILFSELLSALELDPDHVL